MKRLYADLLLDLQRLINAGNSDSPEAEALREQMDAIWPLLSKEDISQIDLAAHEKAPAERPPGPMDANPG